ncbi:MAG: gamma-glutamyltransferase [Euzebya sp.]
MNSHAAGWVAAHSPDTARAGVGVLAAGGNAADAAAAMTLAACVAEPLVVSLLSGMHAIYVSPAGQVHGIDGFVDIPSLTSGGRTADTAIVFAAEQVPYTIGGATFGVPGLVAGCAALSRDHGRLAWSEVVAPAADLAPIGVVLSAKDDSLLEMLEPVMRLGVGTEVYCREDGSLKGEGDRVVLPGIGQVLDQLAEEGPASLYTGALAQELAAFCAEVGSLVDADDLAAMSARRHTPPGVRRGRHVVRTRRGMSPLSDWVAHLDSRGSSEPTVQRLVAVQQQWVQQATGTTTLAVVDAEGGACAVTASLGLGTGDWFHGSQLNSMLGEVDLQQGPLKARTRMGSMMAPTAVTDGRDVVAVLGAAGGSRIPSSMLRVIEGMVGQDLSAAEAVELPRIHRIGQTVHVEPHLPDADQDLLEQAGWEVRRWHTRHHFFGGVSVASPSGAEGDPRRGGAALRL